MNRVFAVTVAGVAVVLGGVVLARAQGDRRAERAAQVQRLMAQTQGDADAVGADAEAPALSAGLRELFGEELIDAARESRSTADLAGKRVAIYFSASWCPPCHAFTPRLVEAYEAWAADGEDIEIVFVSSDRNVQEMRQYMRQARMPWLAVPHGSDRVNLLRQRFGVRGIPTLAVVDAEGRTITTNGRADVAQHGRGALVRWKAN
jgi:thiol-disulfide isomerase/thioredoxin